MSANCLRSAVMSTSYQPQTCSPAITSSWPTAAPSIRKLASFLNLDPSPVRAARFLISSWETVRRSYAHPVGMSIGFGANHKREHMHTYQNRRRNQWNRYRCCTHMLAIRPPYSPTGRRGDSCANPRRASPAIQTCSQPDRCPCQTHWLPVSKRHKAIFTHLS